MNQQRASQSSNTLISNATRYPDGHFRYRIEDADDNVLDSFASLSDAELKLARHDDTWMVDAEEAEVSITS